LIYKTLDIGCPPFVLTRKIPEPLGRPTVRRILKSYLSWEIVLNDADIIMQASDIEETHDLSFWDALIISAAFSKNAANIFTEDLQHGQNIEGIQILNPFKDSRQISNGFC